MNSKVLIDWKLIESILFIKSKTIYQNQEKIPS